MTNLADAFQDPEWAELVILADAVTGLMHELNNSLNRVALQASVVQMQAGEELREEAAQVRKETVQAAALLRPLTMVRQRQRQTQTPVDLNEVVREVLAAVPHLAGRVDVAPAAEPVILRTHPGSLRRLVLYLLRLGGDAVPAPGRLRLLVELREGKPCLVLQGPAGADTLAPALDPEAEDATTDGLLERLAFQSLVRLLYTTLTVSDNPAPTVILEWSPS
jgi:signal transduction histidine kinase